jgi:hypothetical protein
MAKQTKGTKRIAERKLFMWPNELSETVREIRTVDLLFCVQARHCRRRGRCRIRGFAK